MNSTKSHQVAFLGYDRLQLLDLTGPLDTFELANELSTDQSADLNTGANAKLSSAPLYNTFVISENQSFTSESGLKIHADITLNQCQIIDEGFIDTLVIPGGSGSRIPDITQELRAWIDRNFDRIGRVISICTGVCIIADHPYLRNKEVTTHWAFTEQLQQRYPELQVNNERLYIKQGKFYSSAGILSGIDLALNIIEEDHSAAIASKTAKYLVTYLKRAGHQSQFSEPLKYQSSNNSHLDRIYECITNDYEKVLSVAMLAESVHLSERHLNRLIKTHFQMTAAKYIEHLKLEQAKVFLTQNNSSIETISLLVGFQSSDSFRRSFKRKYGLAPQSYQSRFH